MNRRFAWPVLVCLVLIPVAVRIAMFRGLVRPLLVASESMAPTLWGPSATLRCSGCGIDLRVVIRGDEPPRHVTCFQCGTRQRIETVHVDRGDRVVIDTAAYWFQKPKRFDWIAFTDDDGSISVKRLLGLPGESIELAHGNLFASGQPIRRSLSQALATSIPVDDDRFRKQDVSRWRCDDDSWIKIEDGFRCESPKSDADSPLVYHHVQVYQNNRPEQVMDDYPGNQQVSRQMVPVDDLIVQMDCSAAEGAELTISLWVREQVLSVPILRSADGWTTVNTSDTKPKTWRAPSRSDDHLTVAHIDGQLWLAINGQSHVVDPIVSDSTPPVDAKQPIAITCRSAEHPVTIGNLRVDRDLHWWHPDAIDRWSAATALPERGYFVVGDNVPVSIDSRTDPLPISRDQIIGRVIPYR